MRGYCLGLTCVAMKAIIIIIINRKLINSLSLGIQEGLSLTKQENTYLYNMQHEYTQSTLCLLTQ